MKQVVTEHSFAMIEAESEANNSGQAVDLYLPEPKSVRTLMKLPEKVRRDWLSAVKHELKNLITNQTFNIKEKPKLGEQVIPTMIVFKAKTNSPGKLDKLKARCCARGDLQKELPDEDNWSSCIAQRTLRMFIAFITKKGRRSKQLDFIGAYLQANMQSRIFVRLQVDYMKFFPEYSQYFQKPLLLNKTLYGLTVSAKFWNIELTSWLLKNNFKSVSQSRADPSLFIWNNGQGEWLVFIFYVDDGLYCGNDERIENDFFKKLSSRFQVEAKGYAHWCEKGKNTLRSFYLWANNGLKFTYGDRWY